MGDILILMATLVVAFFWVGFQQRRLTTTLKRLHKVEQRLHSAKLTLTEAKRANEELTAETMFLKNVLYDVANGDAHVWIEDDELRAMRTATGEIPVH